VKILLVVAALLGIAAVAAAAQSAPDAKRYLKIRSM
jgi:hypothetical protein